MPQTPLVERCQRLHIHDVQAAIPYGVLATTIQLEGGFGMQELQISACRTNLDNGYRYYLLCPQCGKAFMSLYCRDFGQYACRKCLGLFYASSMRVEIT
jgi:predicted RNA-binding Zn-ribbon protein involved in translation (DUF1610 family)